MLTLDGKLVAQTVREGIKKKTDKLKASQGPPPGLAVILVGDDPASGVYVRNKAKACEDVGFQSWVHRLSAETPAEELKTLVEKLNGAAEVHGILVQLPLPKHLDEDTVLSWIDPKKDPDALTVENIGLFFAGRPRTMPCTPQGVMEILKHYDIALEGKRAVVVGRSQIVGKPMAQMLMDANATVTIVHSRTPDVRTHTLEADVVVVAAGRPGLLGKDDFKKGSVIVDVGIHRQEQEGGKAKLCGDVRFNELDGWAEAATPVPGGVGPMTIAMLLENTFRLATLAEE